ncbi:MAG TPA: phospholipase D-like domain-containing protein [Bacteroidia bacterium]|nr:phospholipase D-like domain-containing protein [Bacteroidia bacterium]
MARQRRSRNERYTVHNTVHLLQSGEEFFSALENMICQAQQEIHLQTYILANDETGRRIVQALMDASRLRQVKVYVLVDAYGSQNLPPGFIRDMENAGIGFRKYGRFYSRGRLHIGRRMHRKVAVADGEVAIVGGINISNHYNDLPGHKAWLDFAVLVKGAVSKRLHLICRQRWLNIRFQRFSKKMRLPSLSSPNPQTADMAIRVSQNDFLRRKNQVAITYRQAFRQSTSSILIVGGYFLPGGQVRRILKNASRRGVSISIIVSEKSDVKVAIYARQYLYDWLLRYNIRIYEYLPANVHGKVLISDNKFISIGSYDLNNLSTYSNIELNLDINDTNFAAAFTHRLEKIIASDCRLITKEEFEHRITWRQRILNWVSYRFAKTFFVLSAWTAGRNEREY